MRKQTGGLIRSIDRGSKGIHQVMSAMIFNVFPTCVEIGLVTCILTYNYGASYAVVCLTTLISYSTFTFVTTQWRTRFRREMNKADNQAGSIATDSMLNFEAVKVIITIYSALRKRRV